MPYPKIQIALDIETAGREPGCVVLSIGAVAFWTDNNEIIDTFYAPLMLDVQQARGATIEIDTVKWWALEGMKNPGAYYAAWQPPEAEKLHPGVAHRRLLSWAYAMPEYEAATPWWAHGATFDFPILAACFAKFQRNPVWRYSSVRDTRTLFDIAPRDPAFKFVGTPHHALDDAKHTAREIMASQRALEGRVPNEPARRDLLDTGPPSIPAVLPPGYSLTRGGYFEGSAMWHLQVKVGEGQKSLGHHGNEEYARKIAREHYNAYQLAKAVSQPAAGAAAPEP